MTWCENAGTKVQQGMLTAFSMWGPPSSCGPGSPSILYKVYTTSSSKAVSPLSCSTALQRRCRDLMGGEGPLAWWTSNPVFIVHLCYLYRQILWADEFHPKPLSWLLTKPHLVVSAPSACHRDVALFGHCIMKATFTSCEGHLKISSQWLLVKTVAFHWYLLRS